jgi:kynurenine formamidase
VARRLVELSHVIADGMVTYPGLPGPEIGDHPSHVRYAPGTEFRFTRITLVGNTGTYVDAPAHRHPGGLDLAGLPLASLADLDGVAIRVPAGMTAIGVPVLEPAKVADRAVLLHTGWDRHWGTAAYAPGGHPHLTGEAAQWLVDNGAALVGIDSVNIDGTATGERPAHTALLAAAIPIVEHLRGLEALPDQGFRFHAAPPLVAGGASFPVRAYAVLRAEI